MSSNLKLAIGTAGYVLAALAFMVAFIARVSQQDWVQAILDGACMAVLAFCAVRSINRVKHQLRGQS